MEDPKAVCKGYGFDYERIIDARNYTKLELEAHIMLRLHEMIHLQSLNTFAFFGIVSNVLFLFTLLRVREMRTITNAYLGSLAFCDAWVLLTLVVNRLVYFIRGGWANGGGLRTENGCRILWFFYYLMSNASFCFTTLVNFERYMATCWPLKAYVIRHLESHSQTNNFGMGDSITFFAILRTSLYKNCSAYLCALARGI